MKEVKEGKKKPNKQRFKGMEQQFKAALKMTDLR